MVTKCPGVVEIEFSTSDFESWGHFTLIWRIRRQTSKKIPFRRFVDEPETGNVDESNFFFEYDRSLLSKDHLKKIGPIESLELSQDVEHGLNFGRLL